ncbi:MAG: alpha/beta fold hydrolase BchO [Gemmatimonadaceae bacterium]
MSTPTWDTLRDRWPNARFSRFVDAAGLRWHVQIAGDGPTIVLLHGSGAATHTWRDVLPLLAKSFTVVAMDLPGHGFTSRPDASSMSIDNMSALVRGLLRMLDVTPHAMVGHSAGGAIALWLASEWPTASVVGINAALAPPNVLMSLLTPGVELLTHSGLTGLLTAKLAESDFVFESLMKSTGSVISKEQLALYRTFATSREHAGAVMSMFANWDLNALARKLPSVVNAVSLIVGLRDEWVPAADTARIARSLRNATLIEIPNAGHLAHEELPVRVCEIINEVVA